MGNGLCERFNRTLLHMLGCLAEDKKRSWKWHVASVVHAYNCTRHASTGFSPYQMLFGRSPVLPVDVKLGVTPQAEALPSTEYVAGLRESLEAAWKSAESAQRTASAEQKQWYDRHQRGFALTVGDLVLVKELAFQGPHKLSNRWGREPHVVVEQPEPDVPVYVVQPHQGGRRRTLHRNHLLPVSTTDAERRPAEAGEPTRRKESRPPPLPRTHPPPDLAWSDSDDDFWILGEGFGGNVNQMRESEPEETVVEVESPGRPSQSSAPRIELPVLPERCPVVRRSARARRPPDRFGDWVDQ
jgi:hypothetical protein